MSERLGRRKMDHLAATCADTVVTGNVGCILQIARKIKQSRGSPMQIPPTPCDLLDRCLSRPRRKLNRDPLPIGWVRVGVFCRGGQVFEDPPFPSNRSCRLSVVGCQSVLCSLLTVPRWVSLPPQTGTTVAESGYPWEREALEFVRAKFPTHEPYRAWSNFEFIADDGSINEVDLLVFTSEGFFLIEIKSRPGRLSGDAGTWLWETDGKFTTTDNPLIAANTKAKKLRALLQRQRACKNKGQVPFIEALVFCSAPELQLEFEGRDGRAAPRLPSRPRKGRRFGRTARNSRGDLAPGMPWTRSPRPWDARPADRQDGQSSHGASGDPGIPAASKSQRLPPRSCDRRGAWVPGLVGDARSSAGHQAPRAALSHPDRVVQGRSR